MDDYSLPAELNSIASSWSDWPVLAGPVMSGGAGAGNAERPGAGAPSTPQTDRGVEILAGVDWLTSVHFTDVGRVAELACRLLKIEGGVENFSALAHGGMGYRSAWVGPAGARLFADPVMPGAAGRHVCLVLPGQAVGSMLFDQLRAEFLGLAWPWHVTRFDGRVDHSCFSNDQVRGAVERGAVHGRFERAQIRMNKAITGPEDTVYIGSRLSERMGRFYSNWAHPERGGAWRAELECKGDRAGAVFADLLLQAPAEWGRRILGYILDFVSFDGEWWADFAAGVERVGLRCHDWKASTLESAERWFRLQVAPMAAVLANVRGLRWLMDRIEEGESRWGSRHRVLLAIGGGVA